MKKKTSRKASPKHASKRPRRHGHYIEFFGLGVGMLVGVFGVAGFHSVDRPYVLGTSVFLARGEGSDLGGNSGRGSFSSGSDREGFNKPIPPNTVVDCVSPDGQHVRQTFEACAALNKASDQSDFSFTVLKSKEKPQQKMPPPAHVLPSGVIINEKLDGKGSESGEIHRQRGKGAELEEKQAHLERNENDELLLRKNNVQAQSHFPLSIDPTTNKLIVTTPSGKKEVAVLPDEAVERILQKRVLSEVENQASSSAADGTDATANTTLTELNNKPVFKVKGFSNKKVFGLFPASFAKTVYVSAEDGSVVKTDETFFSKALETISF